MPVQAVFVRDKRLSGLGADALAILNDFGVLSLTITDDHFLEAGYKRPGHELGILDGRDDRFNEGRQARRARSATDLFVDVNRERLESQR